MASHKSSTRRFIRFDEHHVRNAAEWLSDSAHQHFDDVVRTGIAVYFLHDNDYLAVIVSFIICTAAMVALRFAPTIWHKVHTPKVIETASEKNFDAEMKKMLDKHGEVC